MARLIECAVCHNKISNKARSCCHCGHKKFSLLSCSGGIMKAGCRLILLGIIALPIIFLFILISILCGGS